ncbi:MAG: HD domain-containing protein [Cyanobacteriota bacterium]|nr:HD domain-containing protein [Cyanobacteriota bacterium]MDY6363702.1 HD domain-containing protein [Cyanobacteriota bacterium]MDY6383577.1 HD domain-containing protein [Cyanobacteriota bacterium]
MGSIEDIKSTIKQGLSYLDKKDYEQAQKYIDKAYELSRNSNYVSGISISLSLNAFINYSLGNEKGVSVADDGAFMAQKSDDITALLINEFVKGNINFAENNKDVALIHYNSALKYAAQKDEYNLSDVINTRIKQLQNGMDYSLPTQTDPLVSLVKISRSITALTDIDELLKVIAEETRNAMQADRCTVFLWDKDSNELWSKVALGVGDKEIRFPADKGLAGYVVQTGETVNITNAYSDSRFNPEVDKSTGYHTKTILCMPIMNNNHEIIGAFQVLNKIDGVFTKNDEDLLIAIGGSASIALENAQLFDRQLQMYREQKLLFESFIDTLATSVDARDKITAGHSKRVRLYSGLIADEIGMDAKDKSLLEKAATLHDIGKIGIRDSVLRKEGKLTDEEYKHIQEHVRITHNILNKLNMSPDFRIITEMASSHHEKWDGTGYYRHLKGDEITLGGRILAVADVFDAITSKRHYRDKMPIKNVLNIISEGAGSHFDLDLVDSFLKITLDKIVGVFLSEYNGKIDEVDLPILKEHNLYDIRNYLALENPSPKEQKVIDLFNRYYLNQPDGGENEK